MKLAESADVELNCEVMETEKAAFGLTQKF
jgi:hypothetical protein